MLPLEGLTVLSLEQAVAAPFATRQLADLGARVIKIERPGTGDFARGYDDRVRGYASYFVWLNRSKESLSLNLKHPEAIKILNTLIAQSDVFVQNLAPGAAERLHLGAEELTDRYPRLIVCGISGYGSNGPYRDKKAYDLLIQAETGLVSITGTKDCPVKVGISAADIAAGMYAYSGILTALYMRERTGKGTTLEISLFEALGEWMSQPIYFAAYGGASPARTGSNHASIAPYGPYETSDGEQIFLGIQNEREWHRFCDRVLSRPELAGNPHFASNIKRVAHRQELDRAIRDVFHQLRMADIIERLECSQIAYAHMNSLLDFWDHPQLEERHRWRDVDSPVGPLRTLMPPITIEGVEPRMDPIPSLGQHTDAILQSLGYDATEIDDLRTHHTI